MGNFCSAIATNSLALFPDGISNLPSSGLHSLPEGNQETPTPLATYFVLGFFRNIISLSFCSSQMGTNRKKKESQTVQILSKSVFMDTIWQAFRTLVSEYFTEMTIGSALFVLWTKLMGSEIELDSGIYVDSMEAVLNPEMVEIERFGSVNREALLFGHIYEGDAGTVKFGKIRIGGGGFVGSRSVVMPGVRVENGGILSAISLAMKEEIVK